MDFDAIQSQLGSICDYAGAEATFSTWGGVTLDTPRAVKAIFSAPRYDTRVGSNALDTEYPTLTAPNDRFDGIVRGDLCTVSGTAYSVIRTIPDGYQTTKLYLAYE